MSWKIRKKKERGSAVAVVADVNIGPCDRCGQVDHLEVDLLADTEEALCGTCSYPEHQTPDSHSTKNQV